MEIPKTLFKLSEAAIFEKCRQNLAPRIILETKERRG
jgi:hypothetical protein